MKNPEDCKLLGNHEECIARGLHKTNCVLGISPACIVCRQTISTGEAVLAFLSNQDATAYHGHTLTFPFPSERAWSCAGDGSYFILNPYPKSDTYRSREAFSLHYDCFRFFKKSCVSENALSDLWTMASWKNPWRRAPPPHPLKRSIETKLDCRALSIVAEEFGIQHLVKLPMELIAMIRNLSDSSIFWRYVSALEIAEKVATTTQSGSIVRMPEGHAAMATRLRFSIDERGIRRVERLKDFSDTGKDTTDCTEFILVKVSDLQGVLAEFKDGLLRLVLPPNIPFLQIWDTPCPPALGGCQFYFEKPVHVERLHAISLGQITGLTFYDEDFELVHAHTHRKPSALYTYTHHPPDYIWYYVPITQGETIQTLVIRSRPSEGHVFQFSITTSKNRSHIIGPWLRNRGEIVKIMKGPGKTFVWGEVDLSWEDNWGDIPFIGISNESIEVEKTKEGHYPPTDLPPPEPSTCPLMEGTLDDPWRPSYGRASLDNVYRVRIFQDKDSSQCRGLLFEYDDGSQQAVGLCKFGVFQEKEIAFPSRLFHQPVEPHHMDKFAPRKFPSPGSGSIEFRKKYYSGMRVDFAKEQDASAERTGWITERMAGMLTFWFSRRSSAVVVESESTT